MCLRICSDYDLSHADPQEISAVGISVQIKGRQYHKDPGSADRDHDRTLGQSVGSWKAFGIYLGVGVVLWLWMVLVNWKKHPVEIETPDGVEKF